MWRTVPYNCAPPVYDHAPLLNYPPYSDIQPIFGLREDPCSICGEQGPSLSLVKSLLLIYIL
jgi:hypothetical protein